DGRSRGRARVPVRPSRARGKRWRGTAGNAKTSRGQASRTVTPSIFPPPKRRVTSQSVRVAPPVRWSSALSQTAAAVVRSCPRVKVCDSWCANRDLDGHIADCVLQDAAAAIRHTLRASDFGGRWGGDEFVIVAPHTTRQAARRLAD